MKIVHEKMAYHEIENSDKKMKGKGVKNDDWCIIYILNHANNVFELGYYLDLYVWVFFCYFF